MKKILIIILFFPILVFAYSKNIVVGGETIGIDIKSDGLIVVGLYKIDNEYINNYFKVGDKIISVNDINVYSSDDLLNAIGDDLDNVSVLYKRGNKEYKDKLKLVKVDNNYKTGIYIKASTLGIGTLTYVDNDTLIYGALGHVINESRSGVIIDVKSGISYNAKISSFTKSRDGAVGSKNAEFNFDKKMGSIIKNTNYGIYGFMFNKINKDSIEVASIDKVNTGEAYIYTTNLDNNIEKYKIRIVKVDKNDKEKNIYFEIDDDKLRDMSGGIVQGMSGSPIIQDDKLIGAVTRVIVNDIEKGYGISIITMLEEGDKLKTLQ